MKPTLKICTSEADFNIAKKLTNDYISWLGMDLLYQGIEKELSTFNIMYNKPTGCFIYALVNNKVAGGVGVRYLGESICEMKRLFVYNQFRGHKLGVLLCNEIIKESRLLGYKKMRLDTVEKLQPAINLYQTLGFYSIPAYCKNPDETAQFMELLL